MTSSLPTEPPPPSPRVLRATPLRQRLATRTTQARFSLEEAVALAVPLLADLAERHAAGRTGFVTPASVLIDDGRQARLDADLSSRSPTSLEDRACLAPEQQHGALGDARSSVYSVGALLYELVTGRVVGPGMQRPSELNAHLPEALDHVLACALVGQPDQRPGDLLAMADALHALAPESCAAPPRHVVEDEFDVDESLSMLPPPPEALAKMVRAPLSAEETLVNLKTRLENDRRPRYVVMKDGIDHGPFSAVELLQQIAVHTFDADHGLRDTLSQVERPLGQWEEFLPFAEHARRHRHSQAEKAQLQRGEEAEGKTARSKALVGVAVVTLILAGGLAWFVKERGTKDDAALLAADTGTNVETDDGVDAKKALARRGGRAGPGGGSGPSGLSCEAAQERYVEEMKMGEKLPPDLPQEAFSRVMNGGGYMGQCGVPSSMNVSICAAVQNGRALGVTVRTTPASPGVAACVDQAVRRLSFPSHPKLDTINTAF